MRCLRLLAPAAGIGLSVAMFLTTNHSASAAPQDVTPPIVSQAVAVAFPVTGAKTFVVSTTRVDVTFSEPVDPVTAQTVGNYSY